jgi:hypothetical protein
MTNINCTRFWRPTEAPNSETARAKLPQAARVRREREDMEESLALETVDSPLPTHLRRF